MKRCPTCNRVETYEALGYCRVDGTALIADSGPVSTEAGTSKLSSTSASSEIATSILPHKTDADISRATADQLMLHVKGYAKAKLGKRDEANAIMVRSHCRFAPSRYRKYYIAGFSTLMSTLYS